MRIGRLGNVLLYNSTKHNIVCTGRGTRRIGGEVKFMHDPRGASAMGSTTMVEDEGLFDATQRLRLSGQDMGGQRLRSSGQNMRLLIDGG